MQDINKLANIPTNFIFSVGGADKTVAIKQLSIKEITRIREIIYGEAKLRWSNRLKEATSTLNPSERASIYKEACKEELDLTADINAILIEDKYISLVLESAGVAKNDITEIFKIEANISEVVKAWRYALGIEDKKEEEPKEEPSSPLV